MHGCEKEPKNIYQKNYVLLVNLNNIVREKEAAEARISDLEFFLIMIETLEGQHDAMSVQKNNSLCEEEKLGDERESILRKITS